MHVKIWSLQRGRINPPELLCHLQQAHVDAALAVFQLERDPMMTQREIAQEEIDRRYHKRDVKAERIIELSRYSARRKRPA